MTPEEKERYTLKQIKAGNWRVVRNRARARKLRNRGEGIAWNTVVDAWVWDWQYRVNRPRA